MIKIKKIISIAVFVAALALSSASSVDAANLRWDADTIVTIGSNSYTITNGSAADSLVTDAATLTVTTPTGSTFTLTSANGYALVADNTTGAVQSCSGGTNQLIITGADTEKIITPNTGSVLCTSSSNNPGGGGGGGDTTPPGDVTNVTATVSPGKVVLGWTKPTASDFSSIRIYRSTVSGTRGSQIASGLTGTTYTDTSVTNGTTYYYTIHAVDASGNENTSTTQISAIPGTPTLVPTPTPTPVTPATPAVPGISPATPASPSGVTLYRAEGDHRVYVIKDNKKTWIKTAEEFNAKGYKWTDIVVTSPAVLAVFPDDIAAVVSSSIVTLYRADGDYKVYAVSNGVKQWIKTAAEFTSKGYKWTEIVVTAPETVASYPEGEVIASAVTVKVINTPTLRVRKSNTTRSAILGNVKRSAVFTVLEENAGWYKITLSNGVIGWISGAYAVKQ